VRFGLPEWRNSGWQWEYFGQMVPVKHCDLWQRLDRLLAFHQVDFCRYRTDSAHATPGAPKSIRGGKALPHMAGKTWRRMVALLMLGARRRLDAATRWWRHRVVERAHTTPIIAYE
jgi:hypothetical protein